MTKKFHLFSFFLFILFIFSHFSSPGKGNEAKDFPILKGPYLGQPPPGMTPQIFAPGIISTGKSEWSSAFSPDGKLFVFRRSAKARPDVCFMEQINDQWTKPRMVSFQGPYEVSDFTFAPEDKIFYFTYYCPLKGNGSPIKGGNIWKIEKTKTGWSEPHPLGSTINTKSHESYPSVTRDGTLYFFRRREGGREKSDIYRARIINGQYTEPENLGNPINTEFHEWDPFIAPGESYLILCSTKPDGYGKDDIYISFRKGNGSWTDPINMGKSINSPASENRPYVTPDGKYFFFNSNKEIKHLSDNKNVDILKHPGGGRDIYWVDVKIFEKFRNKALK